MNLEPIDADELAFLQKMFGDGNGLLLFEWGVRVRPVADALQEDRTLLRSRSGPNDYIHALERGLRDAHPEAFDLLEPIAYPLERQLADLQAAALTTRPG